MSGGYEWDSGADNVEESRPVSRASFPSIDSALPPGVLRAKPGLALPRLTTTLLVPTTIPTSRAVGDVIRPTDVIRPMRPARGTRPVVPSSLSTRANLLSSMRDRSRTSDPIPLEVESTNALHDPNNEAPAARRSPLAISGSRRGLPSSLSGRPAHEGVIDGQSTVIQPSARRAA